MPPEPIADSARPTDMNIGRSLGLLAVGCVVASCSSSGSSAAPPFACTEIGAVSQVTFNFSELPIARSDKVKICVGDTCRNLRRAEVRTRTGFLMDDSLSASPALVTLTVRSHSGKLLSAARGTVRPTKTQPNGPKCPPTAWQATVQANGDQLIQVTPA